MNRIGKNEIDFIMVILCPESRNIPPGSQKTRGHFSETVETFFFNFKGRIAWFSTCPRSKILVSFLSMISL